LPLELYSNLEQGNVKCFWPGDVCLWQLSGLGVGKEAKMAKKITNPEEIKALYKEGKISKATYYRGLKKGYVVLGYHVPHKKNKLSPDEFWAEFLKHYNTYEGIAKKAISLYEAWGQTCPQELVNEGALYLLERGIHPADGWAEFKSYVRGLIRGRSKKAPFSIKEKNNHLSYTEVETNKDEDTYVRYLQAHLRELW